MSNIKKIRQEIDRRYEENREKARYDDYYRGMNDGLDSFESFLDTLPEEGFATVNWADGDDDGLRDHYHDSTSSVCVSYRDVKDLKQRLEVVDTLPDENNPEPYNPVYDEDYLNEKIAKATKSWEGVDVDAMLAECRGYEEKPSENLEEAAEKFAHFYDHGTCDGIAQDCFISGAKWQKEQMMKDAVEAKIYGYDDGSFELIASWLDIPNNSIYNDGDKVKIVILKDRE